MRTWGIAALACALLSGCLSGCSDDVPAPTAVPSARPTATTIAAGTDVAAQQALALVPEEATVLTVTDFARVRDQLGDDGHDQAALWRRADKGQPLLTRGMFRQGAGGVTQSDVLWEAHFTGGADGYVVRFTNDADLARLKPPRGAELRAADHLLVSGAAADEAHSWATVPGIAELVPAGAEATYVQRGCIPGDPGDEQVEGLDAYSLALGSTVATARLGTGRGDLFVRMRRAGAVPVFRAGFADGSADPSTGRIGYRVVDPVAAAQVTLGQRLPFAVCAP